MVAFGLCAVLSQAAGVGQQLWLALWSADPTYARHGVSAKSLLTRSLKLSLN